MTTAAARWRTVIAHAWSVLLPLLMLGPALGPGYLLSYDMVWVPQLEQRSDFFGGGAGLPRAVPSDAVIAVLDNLVPGMVLQKLVLLGALVLAAQGAMRLAGPGVVGRLTAVSLSVWNPFVVERLWIGHWTVLLAYAVLFWLVLLLIRSREGVLPGAVWLLVPLGCLSASAGLMVAATLLLFAPARHRVKAVILAVAGNAPWLVAGLLHASRTTTEVMTQVFALHGSGSLPAPLAALGMGGIWNDEVVPASQHGWLAWLGLAGLLVLAVAGVRRCRSRVGRPDLLRLLVLWAIGYVTALLTWLDPSALDQVAGVVPGAGVLRDGARYLALCAPLLVVAAAAGAETLVGIAKGVEGLPARVSLTLSFALFPLMVMTDAAWGINGALRPVSYPATWDQARSAIVRESSQAGGAGDVLVRPFSAYRAPDWNGGRKVLDPLGRFLTPDYVVNDDLTVSGIAVPGDDPRVPLVKRALAEPDARRAAALRRIGIRYVVTDLDPTVVGLTAPPPTAGRLLVENAEIRVVELEGQVSGRTHGVAWWTALAMSWAAFVGTILVGLIRLMGNLARRRFGRGANG